MSVQSNPVHNFNCSALHLSHSRICHCVLTPSFKVGRMMMNIRGLILDDPEHTMCLRTLQFNDISDSEEAARDRYEELSLLAVDTEEVRR
jgi:hypothetical protein